MLKSSVRANFEKELKMKLCTKASGHKSEETVLVKAFKYFDLNNLGCVDKPNFVKAIAKIGIFGFSNQVIEEIFDEFDVNHNGKLEYKEFTGALYNNVSYSRELAQTEETHRGDVPYTNTGGKSKTKDLNSPEIANIVDRIREKLQSRGTRGIIGLGKTFRIMDRDNSRALNYDEFKTAMKKYRMDLNEKELNLTFHAFDLTGDGEVDYDEALRVIKGEMNNFRRDLVGQAFKIIDKDKNGYLEIEDIRGTYNARQHPDVRAGKKTEDDVLLEFLETFETHHNVYNNKAPDHIVTIEEFNEYYNNISCSIDDDRYFELMMNNCWKMNNADTLKNDMKGWSNKDDEVQVSSSQKKAYEQKKKNIGTKISTDGTSGGQGDSEVDAIINKFRKKLFSRGGKSIIGLGRQFKIFDDNNSQTLQYEEFYKGCKDFRVDLTNNEIKIVFTAFDRDGSGSIDYNEFLREVKGEMNNFRKKLVLRAFDKLDIDKSGVVEVNDLKYIFNVKNNPDVRSGKKSEEEVYGEFIETFEMHHNMQRGSRDRRVTKEEFLEYYNNISCSIDDDAYFELMMNNAWKLSAPTDPNKNRSTGNPLAYPANVGREKKGASTIQKAPYATVETNTNFGSTNSALYKTKDERVVADDILMRLRDKIAARGSRGIFGLRRTFLLFEEKETKTLKINSFTKILDNYRLGIGKEDASILFKSFDLNKSGDIDYEEFVRTIVGEMSNFRRNLVTKAFKIIDKDNSGTLETSDLKDTYNASRHPDVLSGKKTEDEVLAEYLDNFEYHFSLLNDNKSKDGKVTLEEFIEYYNNVSMSIDDDKYFEVMMNSCWNLDGSRKNQQRGWKKDY